MTGSQTGQTDDQSGIADDLKVIGDDFTAEMTELKKRRGRILAAIAQRVDEIMDGRKSKDIRYPEPEDKI
ncbi:hypothetical protein AMJ57_04010 [Parcubacteria bacterium SG8_24]|nr:MAG: hypothetical protein AMJ57_04010 [Parcubacteria bacterium SG8_24]